MSFKHNPRAAEILRRRRQRMQAKENGTPLEQETPGYQSVKDAIGRKDYNVLYALLRRQTETFTPKEASALCRKLIETKCTLRAFQTILNHCPPLQDFAYLGITSYTSGGDFTCGGLVMFAAKEDHVPVLQYLLEQDCDPNIREGDRHSPLEAALSEGSLGAVKLLVQRDDVDFVITDDVRYIWGWMGKYPENDRCFRVAAGRLLGEGKGKVYSKVPLLPGLTVIHAARRSNWTLVCRLCRETEVTVEQVRTVLGWYIGEPMECGMPTDSGIDRTLCKLCDALLTACPAALEDAAVRRLLIISVLCAEEEELEHLLSWVEKMSGGEILLEEAGWEYYDTINARFETPEKAARGMARWTERLGSRFRLILRRKSPLPYEIGPKDYDNEDDALRALFAICTVKGRTPKGCVSLLAENVLRNGSPTLISELCAQKKLFWEEDAAALLAFCETLENGDAKRAALLGSGIHKTVDYSL